MFVPAVAYHFCLNLPDSFSKTRTVRKYDFRAQYGYESSLPHPKMPSFVVKVLEVRN